MTNPICGIKNNRNKMKKLNENKMRKEYKIQLEAQDSENLDEFKKNFGMTYSGCFKRAIRLLIQTENQKNQLFENYQYGQKMNNIK
jgi:hypothetical protein